MGSPTSARGGSVSSRHLIARARLHTPAPLDPSAGRAWADRALGAAELDDLLPPASTLVLRQARVDARALAVEVRARAVDAIGRAVRPADGPVGTGADAVLFADDAELLACLARAFLRGECPWWAATFARDANTRGAAVASVWSQHPHAVPAAMASLTRSHEAGALLVHLTARHRDDLAAALISARVLPSVIAAPTPTPRPIPPPATTDAVSATTAPRAARDTTTPTALGLEPAIRELAAALEPARGSTRALGTAMLLAAFAPSDLHRAAPQLALLARSDEALVAAEPSSSAETTRAGTVTPRAQVATPADAGISDAPLDLCDRARPRARPRAARDRQNRRTSTAGPPRRTAGQAHDDAPFAARRVDTRIAGAILLLTVALDLGLYPDFTRPRDRGLPISPWAWLAHTTAHLAGVADPDDQLWALLAELAGDEHLQPGQSPDLRPASRRVDRRLRAALGRRDAARHVITRAGQVIAGPTRVDVLFGLDALDLAIRRCGLDADPGWLPRASRDIRVHYR